MSIGHTPIPGTNRVPMPNARWTEPEDLNKRLMVTVYVRPNPVIRDRPDPTANAMVKPADRMPMDAKTFTETSGASDADLNAAQRPVRIDGRNRASVR